MHSKTDPISIPRRARTGLAVVLAMASCAFADDAIAVREWKHPAWITPSKPTHVEITVEGNVSAESFSLTFALPDGTTQTVPCVWRDTSVTELTCVIPAIRREFDGPIRFWLEADSGEDGLTVARSGEREVPFSREAEIEVSGQADEGLSYPLVGWEIEVLFKPCCYIPLGLIQVERIPVAPQLVRDGLPDTLLTSFYSVQPDDMVKATGGVNIRAHFSAAKTEGVDPETIGAYQWKEKRWRKVIDCIVDPAEHTATFPFTGGGTLVIAGRRKTQ